MANERKPMREAATENRYYPDEGWSESLALLNQVSDAVVTTDSNFQIQSWNKAAERIYGWKPEEVLGRNADELFGSEFVGMTREEAEAALKLSGEVELEVIHQNREGRKLRLQARVSLRRNYRGEVTGTVGVLRNVTERRAEEEALRESEERFRAEVRERKQKEEALRESEERLRLAVMGGDVGIWDWNIPKDIAVLSERYYELIGYKNGEVQPNWSFFKQLIHPDDLETVSKTMGAHLRGVSDSSVIEFRLRRKSGEYRWIRGVGKVVSRDEQGAPIRMAGVIADIGAQKEAEQSLRDLQGFTQSTLDSLSAHIAILDDQGTILATNRSWRSFAQQNESKADEVCEGANYLKVCDAVIGEDAWSAHAFAEGIRDVLCGRQAEFSLEYSCHSPSAQRWFTGRVRRFLSEGPARVVIAHENITARKLAEEALREREKRLALALDNGQMGMWEWNLLTGQAVWNAREFELLGLRASEAKPSASLFLQHVHPEDMQGLEHSLAIAKQSKTDWKHEFRVTLADGTVRWLAGAARFVRGGNGQPERMVGVNYDITERRAFQAELERLIARRTAKLQEMIGELEHFSYAITHDMRAPLRAMKGFADIVTRLCAEWPRQEVQDYLRRISISAERMDNLITDALNYSRAIREELPLHAVDLNALLRGMIETYPEFHANQAHVRLEGEIPLVLGHRAGLTQCFSNLLHNAIKFVAPERPLEVRVWSEARSNWIRIWVEDNGVGISESMLPRIFDMFVRGHNDQTGTGIGLALVRKVVQRMNGRAGVESKVGEGSRFWIDLKRAEAEASTGHAR